MYVSSIENLTGHIKDMAKSYKKSSMFHDMERKEVKATLVNSSKLLADLNTIFQKAFENKSAKKNICTVGTNTGLLTPNNTQPQHNVESVSVPNHSGTINVLSLHRSRTSRAIRPGIRSNRSNYCNRNNNYMSVKQGR